MADNVIINPGIGGAVIATDEILGVQYQRIKLVYGDNGINVGDVSNTNPLPVQGPLTNSELRNSEITVISYEHQKTHEGKYFSGGVYLPSISNNAYMDLLIILGSNSMHSQLSATIGGDAIIQLYEECVVSISGTPVVMSNHNRLSSNTFSGFVYTSPTITNIGNQLNGTIYLPGGVSSGGGGGGGNLSGSGNTTGFHNEIILKSNTSYLLRVTNVSGATVKGSIHLEGYLPTI